MLIEFLSALQIVSLAALALILQTFQMGLQTTLCQCYCCLTETSHLLQSRGIDVAAGCPTMRTLLLLSFNELTPLKLHDALLANDFLALIAHLCLVKLELMANNTVIDLVFNAQSIEESFLPLLIGFALRTLGGRLAPLDVLVEVLPVNCLKSRAVDQNGLAWLTATILHCLKVDLKIEVRHVKLFGDLLL